MHQLTLSGVAQGEQSNLDPYTAASLWQRVEQVRPVTEGLLHIMPPARLQPLHCLSGALSTCLHAQLFTGQASMRKPCCMP